MKKLQLVACAFFLLHVTGSAQTPSITSFNPAIGPVGTLITVTGINLGSPITFSIGGVDAIVVSNTGTQLVSMVMPGAVTGVVSITTTAGSASGSNNFTVTPTPFPGMQQGSKLVGTGATGVARQGYSVSISSDGNTAIVGGYSDNNNAGAAWIYTRSGGVWAQQGNKLVGTGAVGNAQQGTSVSLSSDGNTAIVGGRYDNTGTGAAWVFTRSEGTWTQQGNKLVGTGAIGTAQQGYAVSLSSDGNTAIVGGGLDDSGTGAAWVYIRAGGAWTQQGSKLVGTGATGAAGHGYSVSISSDGNTAIVGGTDDNNYVGAAWVYKRTGGAWTQEGNKLVGTDAVGSIVLQGASVSLSSDGNTAIVGGAGDNSDTGAAWVYTRMGGVWTQQGNKLVGTGAVGAFIQQGLSVSLSSDGNTAIVGGASDNSNIGAAWVYTRVGGVWTQQGDKLVGAGAAGIALQGFSIALSSDGTTAIVGGFSDNSNAGAAWTFTVAPPPTITSFTPSNGPVGTLVTITGTSLGSPTSFTIGGVDAIVVSHSGTELVGMVMPGAMSGTVSITTPTGSASSANNFSVTPTYFPSLQQGSKLVGTGLIGATNQGRGVSVSADGNTAIVGGYGDNGNIGAAWIYTRSGGVWTQQGTKLVGTGATGNAEQGWYVSISADGNTAIVGGISDNSFTGAAWIYSRSNGVWTQQGDKLVGTGAVGAAQQGYVVSISADGNTAVVGGIGDNSGLGAAWIYTRSAGVWTQQGSKLVGTGAVGNSAQGRVFISADGNTMMSAGTADNGGVGAAWVFTRSGGVWTQQGSKLVGTGAVGSSAQGNTVSLSADGNTAIVGGLSDNSGVGAAWVYTRIGSVWTQQGNKLVGTGAVGNAQQGISVSLSADGNTAAVGGSGDNSSAGAAWIFTRSGGVWTQRGNKLVGTGAVGAAQESRVSLSADGNTLLFGGQADNTNVGAAWVFVVASPTITAFSPSSGAVGTLVTVSGTNLGNSTSLSIGGVDAIVVSNTSTQLVGMVMPGAVSGAVSVSTASGTVSGASNFTVTPTLFPGMQQGNKLVGTGSVGASLQGYSVSISSDGNTAIVGGYTDNSSVGAAWVYTRSGGLWTQQGNKLVGTGAVGAARQGFSVSLSSDGNTAIVGGYADNANAGAVWIYIRSGGVWTQQGSKLVGTGGSGSLQGYSVSLSSDGNTAIVGGYADNSNIGAVWVYTRSGSIWTQQGSKLVGTGASGVARQGYSVSLSSDGNTAIVGGYSDNGDSGAAWVYARANGVWSQQGNKLVGAGAVGAAWQGQSVSLSSDGNTSIVGGHRDNNSAGAAWVYTRSAGVWTQQGNKLVGTGAVGTTAQQGWAVSLSSDGNTAIVGGLNDDDISNAGATWVYTRSGGVWTQRGNKLVGIGAVNPANQGYAVSLSSDGSTAIVGGAIDNSGKGAAWTFVVGVPPTMTSFTPSSGAVGTLVTITGTNLENPTAFSIGNVNALVVSNSGTELVAMVMPGAVTGAVSITTGGGTTSGANNFTVTPTPFPGMQQGNKLVGTGSVGAAAQGRSVAVSADGNTAIVGGLFDNGNKGAAWIFVRSGGAWTQQGSKLVGTSIGASQQGISVGISADGNTAIVGGNGDDTNIGAAWVYTRSGIVWTQQDKLVGTGASGTANQGLSVALSADGNTAIVGGTTDNSNAGAAWVFTRSGTTWTQQGSKLVGTGAVGAANRGQSVSLSADGNTAIVGGNTDNSNVGAAWVFVRTNNTWAQQGSKLVGTGSSGASLQGRSVDLSIDGNTAIVGGTGDASSTGAAWIYTRTGSVWTQQGSKLVGTGASGAADQGRAVSISADGNTAIVTGFSDNGDVGAIWIYTRSGGVWTQQGNKLVGAGGAGPSQQGLSVSLSADGTTALAGGFNSSTNVGAAWVFVVAPPPTVTSFTPSSGPAGTLVTISGTNLWNPTSFSIGGVDAIVVSNTGSQLVGLVMPGATTGAVSVTTPTGTDTSADNFTLTATSFPSMQQGSKLVGTGYTIVAQQGLSVSLSADGNTAIVGGATDNSQVGAVWVYTRSGGAWTQQGNKLTGTGAIGDANLGYSVSLSSDGNTAIAGGNKDNSNAGAAWVFTRSSGTWTQQGNKLVGTGAVGVAQQGFSVSISADGNTAIVGGLSDNTNAGAAWIYTRSDGVWAQQGSKLVGTGAAGSANQGRSVCLSSDGNTAIVGGSSDNSSAGAAWIYTRMGGIWSQQGNKLVGTGAAGSANQGYSVCLSSDGNTAIVGGYSDNSNAGAAWIYNRTGGIWSQQGNKLVGTGAVGSAQQGYSVSLSSDGNTAIVGGPSDDINKGAAWIYTHLGGVWAQQGNKLVGSGAIGTPLQGHSVSLSSDGTTALIGGYGDNNSVGAAWVFVCTAPTQPGSITGSATVCSGTLNTYSVVSVSGATSYTWALPNGWTGTSTTNSIDATASATSGDITVLAINACGSSVTRTLAVTVNSVPAQPGTISGNSTICSGTLNTYSIATVSGATSYTWTLPSGWTGTSTTNSIDATSSTTGGDITVKANNACGSSVAQTVTIAVNNVPVQPGTISGNSTICSGTLNTYSMATVSGATSYTWILPNGWTGTSTTNSIDATAGATGGDITATANNACGSSAVRTLTVVVNGVPAQPGTISGVATICSGTLNTYSIASVSGATNYTWTLPNGWTGTSTTNSIDATASTTSGDISVTANNAVCASIAQTLTITVSSTPSQPGTISGNSTICSGTLNTYSIAAVSGASSYTWTLPSGWTGTSTTNSIDATASATGGDITVTANNVCASSAARTLTVTVNGVPAQPGTISGNSTICSGALNTYSIATVSGASSYTWTLPNGWTGASTTNSIDATASATGGDITVTANNACGSSVVRTFTITVNSLPTQPVSIIGDAAVCSGSNNTYSITSISGATSYTWTLPSGWSGTSVTNSITATSGGTGGTISVTANNACGSSASLTLTVSIASLAQPTIMANTSNPAAPVLTSSSDTGNQWFLNGSAIAGATSKTYTVNAKGIYQVQITIGNCVSELSAPKVFIVTGDVPSIDQIDKATIYPNPVTNTVVLRLNGFDPTKEVKINFVDAMGRRMIALMDIGARELQVDVGHFGPGVYFVHMVQGKETQQVRFIKE